MDFGNKLIKMNEVEEALVLLKNLFYLNSGYLAKFCPVMEIHRNVQFTDMREASLDALYLFSRRRAGKDSTLGITYVWHGASKDVIAKILYNSSEASDSTVETRVLNLSKAPKHCAIGSIMKSTVDDNGMMYMLFCRVLSPLVHSEKFMAWNPHVDRHIQLLCVLTIKPCCSIEDLRRIPIPRHISPLVSGKAPDSIALAVLPEFMSLPMMYLIRKAYNETVEQKIEHWLMELRWKQLAGEQLLTQIAKLRKMIEKKKQTEIAAASSQRNEQGSSSA